MTKCSQLNHIHLPCKCYSHSEESWVISSGCPNSHFLKKNVSLTPSRKSGASVNEERRHTIQWRLRGPCLRQVLANIHQSEIGEAWRLQAGMLVEGRPTDVVVESEQRAGKFYRSIISKPTRKRFLLSHRLERDVEYLTLRGNSERRREWLYLCRLS